MINVILYTSGKQGSYKESCMKTNLVLSAAEK